MKTLIVEDDYTSRLFMGKYLENYGNCNFALNGIEAIELVENALVNQDYYDLICLDVMMPKVDGIKVLKTIRELEEKFKKENKKPAKIIMTTALNDKNTIAEADKNGCDAYARKPISVEEFNEKLRGFSLIE